MKIRKGFVSNSSSSSFVICLPENFDINSIDIQREIDKDRYSETNVNSVTKSLNLLIKNGVLSQYDNDDFYIISQMLNKYVIAGIDTGPDEGEIVLVDVKKIRKIIDNES